MADQMESLAADASPEKQELLNTRAKSIAEGNRFLSVRWQDCILLASCQRTVSSANWFVSETSSYRKLSPRVLLWTRKFSLNFGSPSVRIRIQDSDRFALTEVCAFSVFLLQVGIKCRFSIETLKCFQLWGACFPEPQPETLPLETLPLNPAGDYSTGRWWRICLRLRCTGRDCVGADRPAWYHPGSDTLMKV